MPKVFYNACYGGFSLSEEALALGRKLSDDPSWGGHRGRDVARHDPVLAQVVDVLGDRADGEVAALAFEELPSGARYRIDEYDGSEGIEEPDDIEWQTVP